MIRKATSQWQGSGKEGKGSLTGPSGVLDNTPFSFKARFENEDGTKGTNPEELVAAAHAGCFNMALSFALGGEGFTPESLHTEASVKLDQVDDGFAITQITLKHTAKVPGISREKFEELANGVKEGCPISKALSSVPQTLEITFEN